MNQTITPQIAQNILDFLSRVQLQGVEAPAFMQAVEAVKAVVEGPQDAPEEA